MQISMFNIYIKIFALAKLLIKQNVFDDKNLLHFSFYCNIDIFLFASLIVDLATWFSTNGFFNGRRVREGSPPELVGSSHPARHPWQGRIILLLNYSHFKSSSMCLRVKYCDDLPRQIKLSWRTIKVIYWAERVKALLFTAKTGVVLGIN